MRIDAAFRVSFYTTLCVACVSLGAAEIYFLPWMIPVTFVALGLIALAYRLEGRWALNEELANILGLVIAAGSLGWIYFQLPRSEEEFVSRGIPWPAGLLPHVGPLLMGLLVVKMFRPKRLADFWSMQIIALMMMTLGCVLTGEAYFGVLLVVYFASVVWCLALFYAHRLQQACSGNDEQLSPGNHRDPAGKGLWPVLGLGQALQRASVLLPLGFLLFLLAPRRTDSEWIPYKLSTTRDMMMRSGSPTDIDLNRLGKIELSEKPVFRVACANTRGEPHNLPLEQRFRTTTLDNYRNGRWTRLFRAFAPERGTQMRLRRNADVPDMGDDQIVLDFCVNPQTAGNFALAEPVILGDEPGQFPYVRLDNSLARNLFFEVPGTGTLMPFPNPLNRDYDYRQVTLPLRDDRLAEARHVSSDYLRFLRSQQGSPEIADFTHDLLRSLSTLKRRDRELNADGEVLPQNHQKVALALEQYLLGSGEFGYSLNLRRVDPSLDPIADFVLNVKQGHCERFAAALALMLRSVGIPSRLISGFRGVETLGPGEFEVREKNAHSWVEALVSDPKDPEKIYWLTLDPTPADEIVQLGFFDWLALNWHNGHVLWRDMILEYDTTRQMQAFIGVVEKLQDPDTWVDLTACLVCIGIGVGGLLAYRRYALHSRRRAGLASGTIVPFYERFLEVAARRYQLRPGAGQTPREFAAMAAARLDELALPASLVEVPHRVVSLFYLIRYGAAELDSNEVLCINRSIAELDAPLTPAN